MRIQVKIKAIFFDVDGTLLSHTIKQVPESTRRALQKLKEKGIKIIVSTGRHLAELQKLPVKDIDFDGYVTLNGQLCLNAEKQVIYSVPFSGEITEHLRAIFEEKQIPLVLVEENRIFINVVNDTVRLVQKEISSAVPPVEEYSGAPVFQATAYYKKKEEHQAAEKMPSGCRLARWNEGGVDIISQAGGKAEGMKCFLKLFGIAREETMAFGDAENDIDMLQLAGVGVAMGNAEDCVKEASDDVTDSVDADGIEKALKKWGII